MRARDRSARRRVSASRAGSRTSTSRSAADGAAPRARRRARRRHAHRDRSRRARDRPQRARHLRDAARARRRHGGQAVLDRLSHRASAVADRPLPLRPSAGHPMLGAADYKLVHHASNGRSVYSFCMCPGGTVVAATSEAGPRRHQRHEPVFAQRAQRQCRHRGRHHARRDYPGDPLAGIAFQRHWESRAFAAGGGTYAAPAQLRRRLPRASSASTALGERRARPTSPACSLTDLADCLPDYAIAAIREALPAFDRQITGFAMADAVLTGVETRTSSPLRIGRDASLQSLNTRGLYPAGEGAGYAGGILSAGGRRHPGRRGGGAGHRRARKRKRFRLEPRVTFRAEAGQVTCGSGPSTGPAPAARPGRCRGSPPRGPGRSAPARIRAARRGSH